LREDQRLPLRKIAAALDIDSATWWKIEKGDRRERKEYLTIITEVLCADYEELLKF
jgi:transcriptional regulator with XRE-family HTH domain